MNKITETDIEKFLNQIETEWSYYKFQYKIWQKQVAEVIEEYNSFGTDLQKVCVDVAVLFKSFLAAEKKKTKNKKYKQFLTEILEIDMSDM